jgi:hypothetical protein
MIIKEVVAVGITDFLVNGFLKIKGTGNIFLTFPMNSASSDDIVYRSLYNVLSSFKTNPMCELYWHTAGVPERNVKTLCHI